ncbi:MAG TPA: phage protease [Candidatus Gastranaerophilales bacterium]|nr:phage protease [Candidatus Gastranaerophilales bacterium]
MKFFEVFKAGNYPQGKFSQEDVETLAKNYDPKFCEAPITLDHEQKGPAYGWVSELRSENGKLKASFRNVADELKDYVQSGKYKKISVEIYKELEGKKPYLKAVSFLGACIPQVKGMDNIEFKEGESETYIFEIEEQVSEIKMNEDLVRLQNQISVLESQVVLFIDKPNKNEYNELASELQQKVKNMSVQILKMQDESVLRKKAEQELSKLKQQLREKELEKFVDEQITSGHLSPAQKETTLKILTALNNVQKFDESDYIEAFKEFIKTSPMQFDSSEIATKDKKSNAEKEFKEFSNASEDSIAIYNEAKQLSEREKISFKEALLKLYE